MDVRLNLSMDVGLSTPLTVRAARAPRRTEVFPNAIAELFSAREARLLRWLGFALFMLASCGAHALNPDRKLSQYGLRRPGGRLTTVLPQNSVHAILQTRDGFLWFATREGVARFDGVDFTVYNRRNTPQLLSNDIRGPGGR